MITFTKNSLYSIISYLQFCEVKYYLSIIKESFEKHLTYKNRQIKFGACNQWGYRWNVGNLLCRKEEDYSKDCYRNDDIFQFAYLVNFLLYNCTHTVFKLYTYISCNVTIWFIHRNNRSLFLVFFFNISTEIWYTYMGHKSIQRAMQKKISMNIYFCNARFFHIP